MHILETAVQRHKPFDAFALRAEIGVSPYDAAYLGLAGFLEAELVTLDKQLIKASAASTASAALAEEHGVR